MMTTLRSTTNTAATAACLFLLSALLLGNKKCDFEIILSASAFGIAPSVTIPSLCASSSPSSSFHHHHHVRTLALSNSNNNNIIKSTSSSSSSLTTTTTTNPATGSNNSIIIKEEDFPSLSFHSKSLSNSSSSSSIINGSISSDNTPPNLQAILNSIASLKSGSDIRGTFVNHKCSGGTIANVYHLLKQKQKSGSADAALLTPFAAHCFGVAFARWTASELNLLDRHDHDDDDDDASTITVCVGRDPRLHGERIADSFARGAESVVIMDDTNNSRKIQVKVVYTGIATTPSMYEFVRADKCDAAVMITASHLPEEKNGLKFFSKQGGLTKHNIDELIVLAQEEARYVYDLGILPPSSGNAGVLCSERVDYMPYYKETLRQSLLREVSSSSLSSSSSSSASTSPLLQPSDNPKPLSNINIVVNPGNGAGCFFVDVLRDLGAIVDGSIHLTPDGTFPPSFGVPNPEKKSMVEETIRACKACHADIGIMFDTDADRAGFILPRRSTGIFGSDDGSYEPLNKNRLIALLSVIFSVTSPGCTVVTDSTTSEGLNAFLEGKLNLRHFRYLRGYANVIGKARELTESGVANAEVAIETSGHCAMKENGYVDDGTYTAVKIIGLLARTRAKSLLSSSSLESSGADRTTATLLDMISDLDEMPYVEEFRVRVTDGSSATTTSIFDQLSQSLIEKCNTGGNTDWSLDEDNLEGVRARILSSSGGFFMIRQSLHDPVISVQVEASSKEEAKEKVLAPMLELFSKYHDALDYNSMEVE